MVKMHLELEGRAEDVVRTLRRIWGVAPDVGQGHADAQIAPADHNQSGPGRRVGAGDNGKRWRAAARSLDGGAGCRLHGGP